MSRETLFSYLAAFITIILALAVSDMIQSLHRLISARDRVRWAVLPLVAAGWVYLSLLSGFFSLWAGLQVSEISFPMLVWQTVAPTALAFAAFACLPDEVPAEGLDLAQFYDANRRYLAIVIAVGLVADLANNIALTIAEVGTPPLESCAFMAETYGLSFAAFALIWSGPAKWRQYAAWAALFITVGVGYVGWTAAAK